MTVDELHNHLVVTYRLLGLTGDDEVDWWERRWLRRGTFEDKAALLHNWAAELANPDYARANGFTPIRIDTSELEP